MRDYLQTAKEFVYEEDAVGVVEIILILVVFLLLVVQTLHTIERALTWLDRAGQELCRRLPRRKTEENT